MGGERKGRATGGDERKGREEGKKGRKGLPSLVCTTNSTLLSVHDYICLELVNA